MLTPTCMPNTLWVVPESLGFRRTFPPKSSTKIPSNSAAKCLLMPSAAIASMKLLLETKATSVPGFRFDQMPTLARGHMNPSARCYCWRFEAFAYVEEILRSTPPNSGEVFSCSCCCRSLCLGPRIVWRVPKLQPGWELRFASESVWCSPSKKSSPGRCFEKCPQGRCLRRAHTPPTRSRYACSIFMLAM